MEIEEKLIAVANTGPLVSIFQCKRVDLLQRYFSLIHISSFELKELKKHRVLPMVEDLITSGLVVVHKLDKEEGIKAKEIAKIVASSQWTKSKNFKDHLGEAEAIVLMKREDWEVDVLLVDELAARKVAEKMGLSIMGFPGILVKSYQDGILALDEIKGLIEICKQQGTWYSQKLIEDILKKL